jgi:MATE family multidrug resistance protein
LRQVFANFFIGIGETRMVTVASITAVALNLPLAYALTFGAWGLPRMGMKGAAWATVIAGFLPIGIFAVRFFSTDLRQLYNTSMRPRFDAGIFRQLVRFGLPAGLETFVNVGGFTFFTMVMYSYSPDVAAATTIVLNWDMVSFLPLLGISQGASSLVGRYLGAGKRNSPAFSVVRPQSRLAVFNHDYVTLPICDRHSDRHLRAQGKRGVV